MWDMNLSYVGHDSLTCGTRLCHMWDMTLSYMGHVAYVRETCEFVGGASITATHCNTLQHTATHCRVVPGSFVRMTCLIHMWDIIHSYMSPGSCVFVGVVWRIRTIDISQSYMWHDSFVHVTWLMRIRWCSLANSYVGHVSIIYGTWLIGHLTWFVRMFEKCDPHADLPPLDILHDGSWS